MPVVATFSKISRTTRKGSLEKMATNLRSELQQAMIEQVLQAVDIMQEEVPEKPDSTYVRTGNYQRSWTPVFPRQQGDRLVAGIAGSGWDGRHDYTVYVGGDETGFGQQEQHATTGWPLASLAIRGIRSGGAFTRGDDFVERIRRAVVRSKR